MARPPLLEMPSPFLDGYGILRLLEPPGTPMQGLWDQLSAGTYRRPFILEDGPFRSLHFSLRYIQSTMRIDEPLTLELAYTRAMMAFLLFVPTPRKLLLGGLGGGSLVRFIHHHLTGTEMTVVENDWDVITLAPEFGMPEESERFHILAGDALAQVAHAADVDVLLLDIFDRDGLVAGLASIPFFEDARRCLSPGGMLVMNITGDKPVWQGVLEQAQAVFGHEMLVLTVEEGLNYIILARPAARQPFSWRKLAKDAEALQIRYGLDFPEFVSAMERARKLNYLARMLA